MSAELSKLVFQVDVSEFRDLVNAIKLRRAELLKCSPSAFVYFHRKRAIEHEQSQFCWCDPVIITQSEWRPSAHFAKEILYPTIH